MSQQKITLKKCFNFMKKNFYHIDEGNFYEKMSYMLRILII